MSRSRPASAASRQLPGFFWINAPMQFDDRSLYFITQERPDGSRIIEEAVQVPSFAAGGRDASDLVPLGLAHHELTFAPGTRTVTSARLHLGELAVTVTPLLPLYVGMGTGYGFDPDWRHGMYQGPLVVQGKEWDLTTETGRANLWGLVDAVARFELPDGTVGHGLFEYLVLGPYPRYGFEGW